MYTLIVVFCMHVILDDESSLIVCTPYARDFKVHPRITLLRNYSPLGSFVFLLFWPQIIL